VNFDLTDDQVALRDGMRRLCTGRFPIQRVRRGFDRSVWTELGDAGVFSLRADGFGFADAAIVFEELGRALVPGPLVWSHLAYGRLDGVTGGVEDFSQRQSALLVEHLDAVDAVVVLGDEGVSAVPPDAWEATPVARPLDPLTPVHRVAAVPRGECLGDAVLMLELYWGGAVLTAAYLVGMAAACTAGAVDYAKERRQFDRPIASFQAVKHILADMAVRTEIARASVHAAACALDAAPGSSPVRAVAGAKLLAGEAALLNGKAAMQVHGGMGFTWDVDVHLYLKRAWVLDTVLGSTRDHAGTMADSIPR
jgi:alkylation response protein AidB-like acyl-CoA dehydrogenase